MTDRAFLIAVQARRLTLLAKRHDLLDPDAATRAERAFAANLHLLDVILVAGASEADRLCAVGVQMISRRNGSDAIRELLGSLPPDDMLAVCHALPVECQDYMQKAGFWAHAINGGPDGVGWHLDELDDLVKSTGRVDRLDGLPPEERAEFNRFCEGMLRRALDMPHDLSDDEQVYTEAGERIVEELAGDDDD